MMHIKFTTSLTSVLLVLTVACVGQGNAQRNYPDWMGLKKEQSISDLRVNSARKSAFHDVGILSVQSVTHIEVKPSIVECEQGGELLLPLAAYGQPDEPGNLSTVKPYDFCDELDLTVDIVEKDRFTYVDENVPPMLPGSCRTLKFKCHYVGQSRIWINYRSALSTKDNSSLTALLAAATTVISCHTPLKAVYPPPLPDKRDPDTSIPTGILAVGSSMEFVFEGGPRPYVMNPSGHYATLTLSDRSHVKTAEIIDPIRRNKDLRVYRVTCQSIGLVHGVFKIGNKMSKAMPNPAQLSISFAVYCATPSKLQLVPTLQTDPKKCKIAPYTPVPVHADKTFEVDVRAIDLDGRVFHNFSSLEINWNVTSEDGDENYPSISLQRKTGMNEMVNGAAGFNRLVRNYIKLQPHGVEDLVTLTATVKSYSTQILKHENIAIIPPVKLSKEIRFSLVKSPVFNPSQTLSVINRPHTHGKISITGGSGFFTAVSSSEAVGEATIKTVIHRYVDIKPKSRGQTQVQIIDQCLEPDLPKVVTVTVDINGNHVVSSDTKEAKDAKDADNSKDTKYTKETKETKTVLLKDTKVTKDTKVVPLTDTREVPVKDIKDAKITNNSKDTKITKDVPLEVTREVPIEISKDTKELHIKDTTDTKAVPPKIIKDTKTSKDTDTTDNKDCKDIKDTKQCNGTKDSTAYLHFWTYTAILGLCIIVLIFFGFKHIMGYPPGVNQLSRRDNYATPEELLQPSPFQSPRRQFNLSQTSQAASPSSPFNTTIGSSGGPRRSHSSSPGRTPALPGRTLYSVPSPSPR